MYIRVYIIIYLYIYTYVNGRYLKLSRFLTWPLTFPWVEVWQANQPLATSQTKTFFAV